jgi:hypothetical protein
MATRQTVGSRIIERLDRYIMRPRRAAYEIRRLPDPIMIELESVARTRGAARAKTFEHLG